MGLSTLRAAGSRNYPRIRPVVTIAVPKVRQDDFAGAGHAFAAVKSPGLTLPPIAPVEESFRLNGWPAIARQMISNTEQIIFGKHEQVTLASAPCCSPEGHLLVEDVPGVAKTMLWRHAIAQSAGCTFKRIQCTPDLQQTSGCPCTVNPLRWTRKAARIPGSRLGPLFAQFVLVDEINRANPHPGERRCWRPWVKPTKALRREESPTKWPARFLMVIATQNPIRQEGTFPLHRRNKKTSFSRSPEPRLSGVAGRKEMCERFFQLGHPVDTLKAAATRTRFLRCQEVVREVRLGQECVTAFSRSCARRAGIRHCCWTTSRARWSFRLFRLAAQPVAAIQGPRFRVS